MPLLWFHELASVLGPEGSPVIPRPGQDRGVDQVLLPARARWISMSSRQVELVEAGVTSRNGKNRTLRPDDLTPGPQLEPPGSLPRV